MKQIRKNLTGKVYHAAWKEDADKIMKNGLRAFPKKRNKELQVVDFAFDKIAKKLGIEHKRNGILAYPDKKNAGEIGLAYLYETRKIIEIDVNPEKLMVFQYGYVNFAKNLISNVLHNLPDRIREHIMTLTPLQIFNFMEGAYAYDYEVMREVLELAKIYWETGIPLVKYNKNMNYNIDERLREILGNHFLGTTRGYEVALGTEIIKPERMRIV